MQPVTVRNLTIGEGIPKICVPIVGNTKEQILKEAEEIPGLPVDLAEWRADWFESVFNLEQVNEVLTGLRKILGEIPLLFTFRTSREGGGKAIEPEAYIELNRKAAESDMWIWWMQNYLQEMIRYRRSSRGHMPVV